MDENARKTNKYEMGIMASFCKASGFYGDFNYFDTSSLNISLDKDGVDIDKESDIGFKMRVWDNEKFLEYGQTKFDKNELKKELDKLINKANLSKERISDKTELAVDKEILEKYFSNASQEAKEDWSLEKKTEEMQKLKKLVMDYSDKIVNARVAFIEENEEHIFVNEYKRLYQSVNLKLLVMVSLVRCEDDNIRMVYKPFIGTDTQTLFDKAHVYIGNLKVDIDERIKAKALKGGKYKVILAPKATGLLAHESFGHGMESDTMLKGRAMASDYLGKKIGSDKVNIVDYPLFDGKYGQYFFDHEGNLAKKTYLIKEGVVNDSMADLYSKTKLNLKDSFNSRCEKFDHKNYVRMSNTYFEAGDEDLDDLIARVEDGIFIKSAGGGMEDPKCWGVQVQNCFGQRIKNGKLVDEFYDGFSLTGFLLDIVKNISGVSKKFEIDGAGRCGKGHKEWIRVSEGGPYLLIDEVILG